ncbi:PQQ-dependent sugar dehydrogenase [Variovorax sp. PCZ-1]|uniref:PQQ-dependent sugar dehydrogenase n=1 Tax=Variovorax sp. PCZ-1 TaxID=2835533 RepID=UPI0020BEFB95|nr:PQQ-dependent sugar dehydrogenase [Variovorax sp. PCZ-1]
MSSINRRTLLLSTSACAAMPAWVSAQKAPALVTITKGLDHPWGLAFLPDGSALVTERSGRLRRVIINDKRLLPPITGTPESANNGEGGLLGLAIDPEFRANRFVFMAFTETRGGGTVTSVFRARLNEAHTALENGRIIFRQNVVGQENSHYGARIVFDRSNHLFVTTGDRQSWQDKGLKGEVQKPETYIGKIIRITREGTAAPGNPKLPGWAPEVWSTGHRNVQGAALHPETGQLWISDHGPRGGDEINMPEAGKNYGWPVISYGVEYSGGKVGEGTSKAGMEQPVYYWQETVAPSGMTFYSATKYPDWKGSLFVGSLRGLHLARLTFANGKVASQEKLFNGFSRFRDVVQGPDGRLYVLTDEPNPGGGLYVIGAAGDAA